jgi:NADPH:quinone reductase-like Zn-dependent oxidoreductase
MFDLLRGSDGSHRDRKAGRLRLRTNRDGRGQVREDWRVSLRAAGIETYGGEVALLELPEPAALQAGEVLIAVKAAGAGNWDDIVRTGGWDVGRAPPLALGVEAAGEVVAVGGDVDWPAVGHAVMTHPLPLAHQGCWAERLVAPARLLADKPADASWAQAAAFPVPALTAEQVVAEVLGVERGETVLVNGAGGITGGMIVELAARRGATVIATASPRSAERLTALGAAEVLDYHDPAWTSRALGVAGSSGVRAAANAARGGEGDALRAVADGGRLATIAGAPPLEQRDITVANVFVRPDGEQLRRLAASLAAGDLHVDVHATYPLARAAEALALAVSGAGGGAVVLEP